MDLEVHVRLPPPTDAPLISAMDSITDTTRRILEIEARQDEALRELDALERRLQEILAEYLPLTAGSGTPLAGRRNDAA